MSGPGGMGMDYWPALYLSNNQLSGPLPSELGNLTALEQVNLSNNNITGPIPPEIGNMTALFVMELQDNMLSGVLPSELGNLPNMNTIESSFNLNSNKLRGQIPEELCNIKIGLGDNAFCPPWPSCFLESEFIRIVGNNIPDWGIYCNPYPDCPDGYTAITNPPPINGGDIIDGYCFYQDDLDVLQDIIDANGNIGNLEPLELGGQTWYIRDWNNS